MYDDYLSSASSRKALDSLDAESIAKILHTLRKICNHPQLLENEQPHEQQPQQKFDSSMSNVPEHIVSFPRIADDLQIPKLVASRYDPLNEVDLASLNLVFFTHESTLTAITSDRLRKCCASRVLIEELPSTTSTASNEVSSSNVPKVPVFPFSLTNEGWQIEVSIIP